MLRSPTPSVRPPPPSSRRPPSAISTLRAGVLPMVLVVGGSAEFRARCRDAAEAIPAILQEVDAETASLAVDVWGPTAVVTTDQVLAKAPPTMHLVLGAMRGRLLRLPNEALRTRDLEVRMRLAIYEVEMAAL